MYIYMGLLIGFSLVQKSKKNLKIRTILITMVGQEAEGKGALVTLLIYGTIFAILWFVVYAIALSRGIVG